MLRSHGLALLASALTTLPAVAAGPLQITTAMMVAQPGGNARAALIRADKVTPGEEVTLVLAYRNTGTQPLDGVVLANPVPRGMRYRDVAPGTPAPELSVDGRSFAALPALHMPVAGGGSRSALPADVVAVRWRLTRIAPGAAGRLAFRATLA